MSETTVHEIPLNYSVKIQIWECRNLKASNIRPYIKVNLFEQNRSTPKKRSAENPFWNEVFVLHADKTLTNLLSETITFNLIHSKNFLTRDDILGRFELNLSDVYSNEKHAMQKKWLLLTNDFHEFMGYLKVTIAIIGPNESFPPEDLTDEFETDISENVIKPKIVTLYPVQLFVKIYEVLDVPDFSQNYSLNRNFPNTNLLDFRDLFPFSLSRISTSGIEVFFTAFFW